MSLFPHLNTAVSHAVGQTAKTHKNVRSLQQNAVAAQRLRVALLLLKWLGCQELAVSDFYLFAAVVAITNWPHMPKCHSTRTDSLHRNGKMKH